MPISQILFNFIEIQGHGNFNGWALLGRYTIDADGNGGFGDLKLELNCHNSWDNVSILQDNMYILRFKAGGIVAYYRIQRVRNGI
jgi:hypothetical protein